MHSSLEQKRSLRVLSTVQPSSYTDGKPVDTNGEDSGYFSSLYEELMKDVSADVINAEMDLKRFLS